MCLLSPVFAAPVTVETTCSISRLHVGNVRFCKRTTDVLQVLSPQTQLED